MKVYHDIYAVTSDDLEFVSDKFSEVTEVALEQRDEFDYGGIVYEVTNEGWEYIRIYRNWNPLAKHWNEHTFRRYPMLIEVSERPDQFHIEKRILSIREFPTKLIYRDEYDRSTDTSRIVFEETLD